MLKRRLEDQLSERLQNKPKRKFLVHAEPDSFPMKDEVQAISLFDLMRMIEGNK